MVSACAAPAGCTTIKPMPPRPLFHGSSTASAKAVAITASTALPPAARISAPFWAATRPRAETAPGFLTSQFWVGAIRRSEDGDRVDAALVKGIMAGEPLHLVIGRRVGPHRVLGAPHPLFRCHLDRPVRGFALVGTAGAVRARAQQVHPHIPLRDVMDRRVPGLLDAQRPAALGDRHAGKDDLDMPALRDQ